MWKAIAVLVLAAGCAYFFLVQPQPAPMYQTTDDLPQIGPSETNQTVPRSPYEHPSMTLDEQEIASRNSGASQEVNKNLNTEFANFSEPVAAVAWVTAILASVLLAVKAAWFGIPFFSAVASVVQRGFFRWPETPLEWINKLAIYIGLADLAWRFAA